MFAKYINEYQIDSSLPDSAIIDGKPYGNIKGKPELLAKLGFVPAILHLFLAVSALAQNTLPSSFAPMGRIGLFVATGTPIPAVAWYKLDGNALDSSGNGYDGTVNGPIASEGVYGQGYWFDGTNDYISADSAAGAFSGAATWTAWVKSNKTSGEFISKYSPRSGRSYGIQVFPSGTLGFRASSDGTSVWQRAASPGGRIDDGEWRHVAVSYNGTTFSVFFNGVPVYSAGETRAIYAGDAPLWLGAQSEYSSTLPFRGTLDDVRIYNRALSADNIARIMESQDNEPLEELQ